MKWSTSFKPLILGRVCHSRMLLAGIQAEFGLDPRLKHSGVTILGSRISLPQPQFSKEDHHPSYGFQSYIATGSFIEFVSSNYLTTGSLHGRNREHWTLRAAQDSFGCASAQRIDKVPMSLCGEYHEIGMPVTLSC